MNIIKMKDKDRWNEYIKMKDKDRWNEYNKNQR